MPKDLWELFEEEEKPEEERTEETNKAIINKDYISRIASVINADPNNYETDIQKVFNVINDKNISSIDKIKDGKFQIKINTKDMKRSDIIRIQTVMQEPTVIVNLENMFKDEGYIDDKNNIGLIIEKPSRPNSKNMCADLPTLVGNPLIVEIMNLQNKVKVLQPIVSNERTRTPKNSAELEELERQLDCRNVEARVLPEKILTEKQVKFYPEKMFDEKYGKKPMLIVSVNAINKEKLCGDLEVELANLDEEIYKSQNDVNKASDELDKQISNKEFQIKRLKDDIDNDTTITTPKGEKLVTKQSYKNQIKDINGEIKELKSMISDEEKLLKKGRTIETISEEIRQKQAEHTKLLNATGKKNVNRISDLEEEIEKLNKEIQPKIEVSNRVKRLSEELSQKESNLSLTKRNMEKSTEDIEINKDQIKKLKNQKLLTTQQRIIKDTERDIEKLIEEQRETRDDKTYKRVTKQIDRLKNKLKEFKELENSYIAKVKTINDEILNKAIYQRARFDLLCGDVDYRLSDEQKNKLKRIEEQSAVRIVTADKNVTSFFKKESKEKLQKGAGKLKEQKEQEITQLEKELVDLERKNADPEEIRRKKLELKEMRESGAVDIGERPPEMTPYQWRAYLYAKGVRKETRKLSPQEEVEVNRIRRALGLGSKAKTISLLTSNIRARSQKRAIEKSQTYVDQEQSFIKVQLIKSKSILETTQNRIDELTKKVNTEKMSQSQKKLINKDIQNLKKVLDKQKRMIEKTEEEEGAPKKPKHTLEIPSSNEEEFEELEESSENITEPPKGAKINIRKKKVNL